MKWISLSKLQRKTTQRVPEDSIDVFNDKNAVNQIVASIQVILLLDFIVRTEAYGRAKVS